MNTGKHIIALHSPSWAWKSEVMAHILSEFKEILLLPNSTTRQKRWEKDNDYIFLTKVEFLRMRRQRKIIQSTKIETLWVKEYYWIMSPQNPISLVALDEPWLIKIWDICKKSNIRFTKIYLDVREPIRISRMAKRWDSEESISKRVNFDRSHFTQKWRYMCNFELNWEQELQKVLDDTRKLISEILWNK